MPVPFCHAGEDYHWYRPDEDGTWLHKPGSTPAVSVDAAGQTIMDPSTADRDYSDSSGVSYDEFCGFMCVCRDDLMEPKGKKPPKPVPGAWYGECLFPCEDDFPGCLPKGAPSLSPSCCCSCIVRILDVNVGECK